jgi:hypothetical protein
MYLPAQLPTPPLGIRKHPIISARIKSSSAKSPLRSIIQRIYQHNACQATYLRAKLLKTVTGSWIAIAHLDRQLYYIPSNRIPLLHHPLCPAVFLQQHPSSCCHIYLVHSSLASATKLLSAWWLPLRALLLILHPHLVSFHYPYLSIDKPTDMVFPCCYCLVSHSFAYTNACPASVRYFWGQEIDGPGSVDSFRELRIR